MGIIKEHKESKNTKGNYHGYQRWYRGTKIYFRGYIYNTKLVGYLEIHKLDLDKWIVKSETKFIIN
jgi:hypothetical protein